MSCVIISTRSYLDQNRVAIVCSARSGSTKALGTTNLLLRAASEVLRRNSLSMVGTPAQTPGPSTPSAVASFWGRPQAQDAFTPCSPPGTPVVGALTRSHSSPRSASPSQSCTINGNSDKEHMFNATVDLLKSEHTAAAKQSVNDPTLLRELIEEMDHDCEALRGFLFATQVTKLTFLFRYSITQLSSMCMQVIDEMSPRSKDSIVGVGERLACKLVSTILRDRVNSSLS